MAFNVLFVADCLLNSVLFGYDEVAENSTRCEDIVQFLTFKSNEVEEYMLNPTLLSDLGLQTLASNLQQIPTIPFNYMSLQSDTDAESWPSFIYPTGLFHAKTPLLDIVGHLAHDSELIIGQNGQVLFTGTKSEMKDLLSFISEFSFSKNHTSLRKKQSVVPYFRRYKLKPHFYPYFQAPSVIGIVSYNSIFFV